LDAGIAGCWKADTGKEMWKGRLGGDVSGSPVLVGDRIYSVNEAGEWFAFAANPSQFKILDKGKVSDEMFATPVVCDGCVYLRVASLEGEIRKEKLICLIEKKIK
jgi:outer membrane protein assembly factor BamB